MQPLRIYKASAGSGKTFTLAVEYISLLAINPMEYQNILAVTFTNKATAEMKQPERKGNPASVSRRALSLSTERDGLPETETARKGGFG